MALLPVTARWALAGVAALALVACSSTPLSPYTTDTPPLVLVPAQQAQIKDQRARFREIYCAVLEAHGHELPDYRPCDDALTRVGSEPAPTGKPVDLGNSRRHLIAAVVPGLGWECMTDWLQSTGAVAANLRRYGYDARMIEVGGLQGTEENARRIRDAIVAMQFAPGERRLVLIGYSKGAPDILEAIVRYPEIREHVAAVVSAAGAIAGSPLANDTPESQANWFRHIPGATCEKNDGTALKSLWPSVRHAWLAENPLPADFPYYSLVTYPDPARISAVLRHSYRKLSQVDARNDSQLLFYDQVIPGATLVGYVNADHWALAVPLSRSHPWVTGMFATQNAFPREALVEALMRFVEDSLPPQKE